MTKIAEGVGMLGTFPPHSYNAYLVDGVLVDSRTRLHQRGLLRRLHGEMLRAHLVTHAHVDHTGSSAAVCEKFSIPLWASEGDADAVEAGDWLRSAPTHPVNSLQVRAMGGPGHPVARRLVEGDEVGSFTVLETPGHSPGHIALWRERDRVLLAIDVIFNLNPLTGMSGLREPPRIFTPDPALNRESARRLAQLRPTLTAFGHGPPLRDPGRLADFVDRLKTRQ